MVIHNIKTYESVLTPKQKFKKFRILIRSGTKLEDLLRLDFGAAGLGFEPR